MLEENSQHHYNQKHFSVTWPLSLAVFVILWKYFKFSFEITASDKSGQQANIKMGQVGKCPGGCESLLHSALRMYNSSLRTEDLNLQISTDFLNILHVISDVVWKSAQKWAMEIFI